MIEPLAWDTAHFGVPIARVAAHDLDGALLDAALDEAGRARMRCLYLLLDARETHASQLAQERGFVLRDVRVELERPITAADGVAAAPAETAREASDEQRPMLEALVRRRFTSSRFFADPGFPRERCEALYAAFLHRGLETPDRRTLTTADARGVVVCHFDASRDVGTIDLIAVDEGAVGAGLGGALVATAVDAFARAGLKRAEVVTQASNLEAQRLYQRAGFRTSRVGLWFHRWLD